MSVDIRDKLNKKPLNLEKRQEKKTQNIDLDQEDNKKNQY